MSVIDAARSLAGHRHHFYSVVDDQGDLVGVVEADSIDAAARDGDIDRRMEELCHAAEIVATADMPVTDLVRRMGVGRFDPLPGRRRGGLPASRRIR